jgi:hypothetical protein
MTNAILIPKGLSKASFFLVYGGVFLENEVELNVNQNYDSLEDALKCYFDLKIRFPENSDIGIQKHTVKNIDIKDTIVSTCNNSRLPEKENTLPTTRFKHIESGKFLDSVISKDSINGFYGGLLLLTIEEQIFFVTAENNGDILFEDVTDNFEKVDIN